MRPFRMATAGAPDPRFAILVLGHRMPFPGPVDSAAAPSWFAFLFHQPAVVHAGEGERRLPGPALLVVGPGDRIHHRPAADRLERSWIRCSGTAVPAALSEAGVVRREPLVLARVDGAIDLLLALHRTCSDPRGATPPHQLALFCAWLHATVRDAGEATTGDDGIAAVRRHLDASFMLPQRLDDLAARAGCSRAQFCRRFRRVLGCSPLQYALRLRLEAAHELLLTTDRAIPDIAADCGFADRFHLSRAFAARYRVGPAACRRSGSPA